MNGNKAKMIKKRSRNSPNVFKAQTNTGYTRLAWTNNINQFKLNTIEIKDKPLFKQTLGHNRFNREYEKARPLSMKKAKGLAGGQGRDVISSIPVKAPVMHVKKPTGERNRRVLSRTEKFERRLSSLCEIYKLIDSKKVVFNSKDNPYITKNRLIQKTFNRPIKISLVNSKERENNLGLAQDMILREGIYNLKDNKLSMIQNDYNEKNNMTQSMLDAIENTEDDTQLTFRSNNRNKSYNEASKRSILRVPNQIKPSFFFNLKYRGMGNEECSTPVFQE